MQKRNIRALLPALLAILFLRHGSATAQEMESGQRNAMQYEAAVLAVADSALAAISREDFVALTDLMVEEAQTFPTGVRNGTPGYTARSRASERTQKPDVDIVERGFDAEVRVSGTVASVWYPYDLYIDGKWSHCGIDVFTLVRSGESWLIASLAWSVEQPPACRRHPDGPPELGK